MKQTQTFYQFCKENNDIYIRFLNILKHYANVENHEPFDFIKVWEEIPKDRIRTKYIKQGNLFYKKLKSKV